MRPIACENRRHEQSFWSRTNQRNKYKTWRLLLGSQTSARSHVWTSVWKSPHTCFFLYFFFLRNKQNIFLVVRSKILLMILPRVCLPPALTGNGAFTLTSPSYFQEILEYVNSPDQMWTKLLPKLKWLFWIRRATSFRSILVHNCLSVGHLFRLGLPGVTGAQH